jgi:polyisoprenoid-binding protein YceI
MKVCCGIGVLALAASALAGTVEYDVRPAEGNRFALTVEKTGLMSGKKHLFVFERYHGTLAYDSDAPERSRMEFAIEAGSAVLKDDWVSEKDRQKILRVALDDMMEAGKHPELRFSSTQVARTGERT